MSNPLVIWRARSKWDYLAIPAYLQWLALLVGLILTVFLAGFNTGYGSAAGFATLAAFLVLNSIAWLAVFATALGSRHHDHLEPTMLYHVGALLFAPIVGVHYLTRTAHGQ